MTRSQKVIAFIFTILVLILVVLKFISTSKHYVPPVQNEPVATPAPIPVPITPDSEGKGA